MSTTIRERTHGIPSYDDRMTLALERPISPKLLTFDEFLVQYREDDRFELIDGEVFDLEPTGPHEQVASFITRKLDVRIDQFNLPYFAL